MSDYADDSVMKSIRCAEDANGIAFLVFIHTLRKIDKNMSQEFEVVYTTEERLRAHQIG